MDIHTKRRLRSSSTLPPPMLALVTVDRRRPTLICTPEIEFSPFSHRFPIPSSLSQPSSKPGFGLRAERRCGGIRNMDLRTLGDIDGYERSRGGKTPLLECRCVTRRESWLGMHVCTYICSVAVSHATIAQWVFFSFRLIIKSYSCGLTRVPKRHGVRNDKG